MRRRGSPPDSHHNARLARIFTAEEIPFEREFRFGKAFAREFWNENSPGFLADFKIPRDDGAILLVEVQGGVWRRGKSAHTGTGQIRDGAKSCAAIAEGYTLMAATEAQIKSGAIVAAVKVWRGA